MVRWITADVTLSPLTLGDSAIEMGLTIGDRKERIITAFRSAMSHRIAATRIRTHGDVQPT